MRWLHVTNDPEIMLSRCVRKNEVGRCLHVVGLIEHDDDTGDRYSV